jgi:hypothetical protein
MDRDTLFIRFAAAMFTILALYGCGALVVVLFGDINLARVMLSAFASMFAGILGLGSGYLLGRNGNGRNGKK